MYTVRRIFVTNSMTRRHVSSRSPRATLTCRRVPIFGYKCTLCPTISICFAEDEERTTYDDPRVFDDRSYVVIGVASGHMMTFTPSMFWLPLHMILTPGVLYRSPHSLGGITSTRDSSFTLIAEHLHSCELWSIVCERTA